MEKIGRGNLYVVSGPSGTGKGTICAAVTVETDAALSVSMTTRAPREREVEGKSYYFVEKERFREIIAEDGLFEYAEVYGEYYGTPKAPVTALLEEGRDVILEIEVMGAMQIKNSCPEAILVFVLPPSQAELKRRIEGRGTETPERMAKRLERVEMEISYIEKYDYIVVNDDLADAINDLLTIMRAEKLRVRERAEAIIHQYHASDNEK